MKTYRLIILIVIIVTLYSCASEDRSKAKSFAPTQNESTDQKATITEEASVEKAEVTQLKKEEKNIFANSKKWRKKARQQLETIQDLALILQDSTLDTEFKIEIENELATLYANSDSSKNILKNNPLDFKNFKQLENNGLDTLIMHFRNKKLIWVASFIVIDELKQFGKSSERVELLKLVSIEKEN